MYLTQFLTPSVGGGEAIFYNIAKYMIKCGHGAHVICYEKKTVTNAMEPSSHISDLYRRGAKIYSIKPAIDESGTILLSYFQQLGYIINAIREGTRILRKENISLIHANTLAPVVPAYVLGKFFNIPVLTTVHHVSLGHWKFWSSQRGVSPTTSFIGPLFERMILRLPVDMVHVVSDNTKNELISTSANKTKITVIYNGIDIEEYADERIKKDYCNYILYIGRLVITKNLSVILSAFEKVIRDLPDSRLIILGAGPMRGEWEAQSIQKNLQKHVIFMGHVSHEVKLRLLATCSAVILPSLLEGFGLVILEAFAMSKPVLVSNVKPLTEIVDNYVDGFLLSPHDSDVWSEKIIHLLKHKDQAMVMGNNGRRKVFEKFSLDVALNAMKKIYLELAATK